MNEAKEAWIGMGSNEGDRFGYMQSAVNALLSQPGIQPIAVSKVVETEPWGFDSPDLFLNAVIGIRWAGKAEDLLTVLLSVETQLGRTRSESERYSSRTIDLDLLLFGEEVINSDKLVIPHPRMLERRFVLEPLNELIPSYIHPVKHLRFSELLKDCIDESNVFIHAKALSINH
ncbi:MAG: 2-amino-4-hydroxy-6-hydroxymethyldihydropteridine diphosphokinase [Candidatus Fluviicola riflensis]|nr:MAG: 2-amino-4-hydroxy-6-hydroxymethyldihydropteridine diphosphokinase [Candidatus Fluviicola riflensis]OGS76306.1 MAG: 2-amino-4-hydroxy-6-hydroxymethyldihydropteridine diphosphokinase [Candidatus Fluviicola riflensis]OGS83150.1 MAG: 2-amino-4-hydroxy-6-hydroxymethyldihydropteridine diphosphokinase [Fluviicola sp. RIFCSPHIGHO2_01_FULL_43_53]OGS83838.1 MAG: 2-amino-4-hydroxy-6-hydroxymethyldihydropteridine diphosphokinase [Fluviicola sp. RIFCSPHIGHO2_12_FULL_43_24]